MTDSKKPMGYWTREKCVAEAQKYKTKQEWRKASGVSFTTAYHQNWAEECTQHMVRSNVIWTLETCVADAKKYTSVTEWRRHSPNVVAKAKINGWLTECTAHMKPPETPRNVWTLEACQKDALNYQSRTDWFIHSRTAYAKACRKGWIDLCCGHMGFHEKKVSRNIWTLEACIEDARKYPTRMAWLKNSNSAYTVASKNGWHDQCSAHMITQLTGKPHGYWTLERCQEDAKKYSSKKEWKLSGQGAYMKAQKYGWLNICCSHMPELQKPKGFWNLQACMEDAKRYIYKKDWYKNSPSAFQSARINGWLNLCCAHMIKPKSSQFKWDFFACREDARKYTTRQDWQKNSAGAYQSARKHDWFDVCCAHMITPPRNPVRSNKESFIKFQLPEAIYAKLKAKADAKGFTVAQLLAETD